MFKTKNITKIVNQSTKVTFKSLSKEEIEYYVNTFKPLDKAGAYGIQEWIGFIGISHIEGSFFNVMAKKIDIIRSTVVYYVFVSIICLPVNISKTSN